MVLALEYNLCWLWRVFAGIWWWQLGFQDYIVIVLDDLEARNRGVVRVGYR